MYTDSIQQKSQKTKDKKIDDNIYDLILHIIDKQFQQSEFLAERQKIEGSDQHRTVIFATRLEIFTDKFIVSVFEQLIEKRGHVIGFIIKDQNELWKFFSFLFNCLSLLNFESEAFGSTLHHPINILLY